MSQLSDSSHIDVDRILEIDEQRRTRRMLQSRYDPILGNDEPHRVSVATPVAGLPRAFVPRLMLDDPAYKGVDMNALEWERLRCHYDFEFWCARCVVVKLKSSEADGPLILNAPQRRVLAELERQRLTGLPIRLIILKARQWGGSTLVQMYMAWIQCVHRRNWNSVICAHVKDSAANIRGMYTKMLANYPPELWEGEDKAQFKSFERCLNVRQIEGRGCRVTVTSAESQEAVRGADFSMAHLSETSFWKQSPRQSPDDLVRAICGSIALEPYSLIAMESTADGVGNYFHREWCRAREGKSDKIPIFVPWYEIEIYSLRCPDRRALAESLTAYERQLWDLGLDLDRIFWHRCKLREYGSPELMHAEYPTTEDEAFTNTGRGVFASEHIAALRATCTEPECGDIGETGFAAASNGSCLVWEHPVATASYVAAVDVGGRSAGSDWSVISVLKSAGSDGRPEVVAQWRGHCDHDRLAVIAACVGRYYFNALLIIESNTFETALYGGNCEDSNLFVLNRLAKVYPNIYRRQRYDVLNRRFSYMVGFHTNRSTKGMLIANLVEYIREGKYVERSFEACDEFATYEQQPNGVYAAKLGCHDDILMSRALALHLINEAGATTPRPLPSQPSW